MKNSEQEETLFFFFDVAAWRYYYSFFHKYYKTIILTAVVSAAQGVMILPILLLIRYAFDDAIPNGKIVYLIWICLIIFFIRLINSAISIWLKAININIIHGALRSLRKDIIVRLYSFSRQFHTQEDQKILQARIVQDTERLSNMSNTLVSLLLPSVFTSVVLSIVLLFLNWYLFIFLILLLPVLFFSNQYMGKLSQKRVFQFQRSFERFSKGIFFVLRYMDLTKIQAAEKQEIARQTEILDELKSRTVKMFLINAINGNLQSSITGLSAVLIIIVGGTAVANNTMTLGGLLSFYLAASFMNNHISSITSSFSEIVAGNESLVTLKNLSATNNLEPYHGLKKINVNGFLSLKSVWFQYGTQPVLEDVNLQIKPGTKIAIIGKNGSGKTTILNLILGFYAPYKGELIVDTYPYNDIDMKHLRRSIGVVMQHPPLFSGTVYENITYGVSDSVDETDVIQASKKALAHNFIQNLPDGYRTQIGEDGILLSGGECQRLAIARALISQPKLLVLDEPTNHLDSRSVEELMESLDRLSQKPAILLISHDKSVIRFADIVYLMENKKLQRFYPDKDPAYSSIVEMSGAIYG